MWKFDFFLFVHLKNITYICDMNKNTAKELAKKISNEEIQTMFDNAKNVINIVFIVALFSQI